MPLCCFVFLPFGTVLGVSAWLISKSEKRKIEAGLMPPSGIVDAGYILGIVGTSINVLIILLGIAYFVVMMTFAIKNGGNNF
jgi:hypothetical protein